MHPAFSVIFFTTASGAGFGLFAWIGWAALCDHLPGRMAAGLALVFGAAFAAAGLCSSVLHLGQPRRAWRAFSQWRSSWLSREGVVASASFLPALWLGWCVLQVGPGPSPSPWPEVAANAAMIATPSMRIAGGLLLLLSLATIGCTAMIYASLKPVPAWTHPLVLPVYLGFALFTGGLLVLAIGGFYGFGYKDFDYQGIVALAVIAGAVLLALLKWGAWRYVDFGRSPVSRNDALGLPHARPVHVFERPHTEANYLLKEMGYVLARKHARRLRLLALVLFAVVPALCALPVLAVSHGFGPWMALAFVSAMLGALVERWLFFAEARHLVTLYY
jgi:DMSO reductase anchor subunit